jgi:DNA-binding NarL/FixJ family response regulator
MTPTLFRNLHDDISAFSNESEVACGSAAGETRVREVVIVDPKIELYGDFVQEAQEGNVGLHFCVDGRSAVRLARRFRADVWLVSDQLPDIDGLDLVEMLAPQVMQANVDPTRSGSTRSLSNVDRNERSGIFIVADDYCLEDEQRALSCGVAGYLVRPVTMDVISTMRDPAANVA